MPVFRWWTMLYVLDFRSKTIDEKKKRNRGPHCEIVERKRELRKTQNERRNWTNTIKQCSHSMFHTDDLCPIRRSISRSMFSFFASWPEKFCEIAKTRGVIVIVKCAFFVFKPRTRKQSISLRFRFVEKIAEIYRNPRNIFGPLQNSRRKISYILSFRINFR